jgi:hypothetical protein
MVEVVELASVVLSHGSSKPIVELSARNMPRFQLFWIGRANRQVRLEILSRACSSLHLWRTSTIDLLGRESSIKPIQFLSNFEEKRALL